MSLEANIDGPFRPAETPVLTASALAGAGRAVPANFAIDLEAGQGNDRLEMLEILRVLPGRRVVGRARWRGQTVLAKLFVAQGTERAAASEAEGLRLLKAAAIPAPAVLLSAGFAGGGQALLLEYLESARSLAAVWSDAMALREVMLANLRLVFALLGRLHASGYGHTDLHLGNILLAQGRCYLIDGDAVRSFPAGARERESAQTDNLALWCAQLPLWTISAWPEALNAYTDAGAALPEVGRFDAAVDAARRRRLQHFLAKTGRDCTQFSLDRHFSCVTVSVRAVHDVLSDALNRRDAWVREGTMLKDGRTSTVVRVSAGDLDCVVKRYNLKNLRHALSRCWRPSRAWHSWRAGHLLRHLGVATPEPLAVLEERFGFLRRRAFLVTRHCAGRSLLDHLDASCAPSAEEAEALLEFFRALHLMGIEHGDLKATNLLWHEGRIWVIDLDAVRQHDSRKTYARAWRRDRSRFLANWPEGSRLRAWLDTRLPAAD